MLHKAEKVRTVMKKVIYSFCEDKTLIPMIVEYITKDYEDTKRVMKLFVEAPEKYRLISIEDWG